MYTNCTNKIENFIYKLYDIPIKLITEMEAQLYEEVSRLRYGHCESGYQMPQVQV